MRVNKRIGAVAAVAVILLAVPLAFSLGFVEVPKFPIESASFVEPASSTVSLLVNPNTIVKDYLLDPGYQIGDTFQVHLNISEVTDLYTWNANITWNPLMLNFTRIVSYGNFLAQTDSPYGTSRTIDITNVSNETGYVVIAESILGEYSGVSGNGRLVTVEFLIVGYGSTELVMDLAGALPTELINSTGSDIASTVMDGYFRNKLMGDANGDMTVDIFDIGSISAHWYPGPPVGSLGYDREADINLDGSVDIFDIGVTSANWGRTVP